MTAQRCQGFTLIEMLLTLTVGSTLMMLAMGLVHQSLLYATLTRSRGDDDRISASLIRQFRDDAHEATAVELEGDASIGLIFESAERRINYTIHDTGIVRQCHYAGKQVQREEFMLSEQGRLQLEVLDQPPRAILAVRRSTTLAGDSSREDRRVEAVIGRRLQFQAVGGDAK
jgi:prepilin-type N-terminal cleavage/methylation domain-containing protein